MILEKKTLKKNPSNQKPNSYSFFIGEGRVGEGERGANVLHTDRRTDPPTKRVLEEHSLLKIMWITYVHIYRIYTPAWLTKVFSQA